MYILQFVFAFAICKLYVDLQFVVCICICMCTYHGENVTALNADTATVFGSLIPEEGLKPDIKDIVIA